MQGLVMKQKCFLSGKRLLLPALIVPVTFYCFYRENPMQNDLEYRSGIKVVLSFRLFSAG
ncbi:MAG: hypothetical protein CME31_00770 [Gimesia sp.]|uniref:Uncharacterized protein n=1 Tax=Gimesia maris TaxID=122 RepID=A0A3D3R854_9PLAN|nr:hypothetical protein [Gimesia sp.]HCO24262.1 hypothetical protein [Gimesia maris]|tara:strand:+ start:208281 stop:208460 length:180 start_codon:yes stop_codon:yes gene_type:complete